MSIKQIKEVADEFAARDKKVWDERGDYARLLLAVEAAEHDMPAVLGALDNALELAAEWEGTEQGDRLYEALSALLAEE